MLDHKKISEIIVRLEKNNNVNLLTYSDINIWPLVRLAIYQQRHNKPHFSFEKNAAVNNFRGVYNYTKNTFTRSINYINNNKLKKKDLVFFSRSENNIKINGIYCDKHVDPIITKLPDTVSYTKIEMLSKYEVLKKKQIKPFYFHGFSENLSSLILEEFDAQLKNKLLILQDDYYALTKNNLSLDWVLYYVVVAKLSSDYFTEFLKIISPKCAFVTCYYSPVNMGFIHACKKLKITNVDLQHGQQGKYHPMYNRWTCKPSTGYGLLPERLWVWNNEELSDINLHESCSSIVPHLVGGNQFISSYLNNPDLFDAKLRRKFQNELEKYTKIILVVCSNEPNFDELIDEKILMLMKENKSDWFWLIRLHPNSPKKYYSLMRKKISKLKIKNYDMNFSNKLNLPSLVMKVNVLITNYSSACIEAMNLKMCRIVVHEYGEKLYKNYIKNRVIYYGKTTEQIRLLISQSKAREKSEVKKIIEFENIKFKNAIENILTKV
jgi:hypothetical protein